MWDLKVRNVPQERESAEPPEMKRGRAQGGAGSSLRAGVCRGAGGGEGNGADPQPGESSWFFFTGKKCSLLIQKKTMGKDPPHIRVSENLSLLEKNLGDEQRARRILGFFNTSLLVNLYIPCAVCKKLIFLNLSCYFSNYLTTHINSPLLLWCFSIIFCCLLITFLAQFHLQFE